MRPLDGRGTAQEVSKNSRGRRGGGRWENQSQGRWTRSLDASFARISLGSRRRSGRALGQRSKVFSNKSLEVFAIDVGGSDGDVGLSISFFSVVRDLLDGNRRVGFDKDRVTETGSEGGFKGSGFRGSDRV